MAEKKWEGLQKKVESYLKRWNMIERGEHIVAGISGGADSVCLLFVLLRLRETQGIQVTAVHVNHLLRGKAADGDESFVAELCKRHDVPCRVFRIHAAAEARKRSCSLEEAGREIRRESMKSVLEEVHADKIAFAHHQGDNAETVLMNLCRGSQVKGMRGILPVAGGFIHPCVWESQRSRRLFRNGACPGGLTLLISRMTTRETASETKLWGNFSKSIRQPRNIFAEWRKKCPSCGNIWKMKREHI